MNMDLKNTIVFVPHNGDANAYFLKFEYNFGHDIKGTLF